MTSIPDYVIRRFACKRRLSLTDARRLFTELESFLNEAAVRKATPNHRIDDAWHEFILHTKDYLEFCQMRYGRMIHHIPTSPTDSAEDSSGPADCAREILAEAGVKGGMSGFWKCCSNCSSD